MYKILTKLTFYYNITGLSCIQFHIKTHAKKSLANVMSYQDV